MRPSLLLLLPTAYATLNFEGGSSSIVFDNNARLTASCATTPDCCTDYPAPTTASNPAITRMAPKIFNGVPVNGEVKLRLSGVPLSCANAAETTPCALPSDDLDLPAWTCEWENEHAREVVGPIAAGVIFHASVNETTRKAMLVQIHAAYMSSCATGCQRYPPQVTAVVSAT